MIKSESFDLFASIPVSNRDTAAKWYEQLLGFPPSFYPNDLEAVWEIAEHRYLYVEQRPGHEGHSKTALAVSDLKAIVAEIAERGLNPSGQEDEDEGARKITYLDPDGNEFGFIGTAQ